MKMLCLYHTLHFEIVLLALIHKYVSLLFALGRLPEKTVFLVISNRQLQMSFDKTLLPPDMAVLDRDGFIRFIGLSLALLPQFTRPEYFGDLKRTLSLFPTK
jgi:hypothetical protein